LIPRDGDEELIWFGPGYLQLADILNAVGATDSVTTVSLTLQEADGSTTVVLVPVKSSPPEEDDFKVGIPPLASSPNPLYLQQPDKNYWLTELKDGIVYVQFNHVKNDTAESLDAFAVRLQAVLRKKTVRGLIVDLRHNNGGNASIVVGFLRTLIWFERQKGDGAIVGIIGRNTYSAAQNFTSYLNMMTKTVFVGEPTGSKPVHIGDESEFLLPYSGLRGSIACYIHHDAIGRDARVWIPPDAPVPLSYADYRAGRDPALETAKALLARRH
jgi:hypothetical protein